MTVHMIEFNGSVQMDFIIGTRKEKEKKRRKSLKLRVVKNGTSFSRNRKLVEMDLFPTYYTFVSALNIIIKRETGNTTHE
jgi:hypothetical protein